MKQKKKKEKPREEMEFFQLGRRKWPKTLYSITHATPASEKGREPQTRETLGDRPSETALNLGTKTRVGEDVRRGKRRRGYNGQKRDVKEWFKK